MRHLVLQLTVLFLFSPVLIYGQEKPWTGSSTGLSHGRLKVSENQRFLMYEDGTPFFYLGDTAWELFHRLTFEEANLYLENRRSKGFTVIQAVILAELDGLNTPNMNGDKPLLDNDPQKPNEAYFRHVDRVLKLAEEKGLIIGLLPTWGDKIELRSFGIGPIVFNEKNAYEYGSYVGKRYTNHRNIIWIIGGDRNCVKNYTILDAMARGVRSQDSNHLMTFHPTITSSECFHNSDWLDFNTCQSGHGERFIPNYDRISADYALMPIKPCMDSEPIYEEHPINWNPQFGYSNDTDVRRAAYWALFAGAHGHTYGAHSIWQFYSEGRNPISFPARSWQESIDLPGSFQMLHLRRLMQSRPLLSRVPDQSIITSDNGSSRNRIIATRGDGYAFIFIPEQQSVTINLGQNSPEDLTAWWFNPRTGTAQLIERNRYFKAGNSRTFITPVAGIDWVLVIDDPAMGYGTPGEL
jgi:hypothetical protein